MRRSSSAANSRTVKRRARAVEMRSVLPQAVLEEIGKLDPAAIEEVCDEAWPDVRNAEELHDALLTLVTIPVSAIATRGNSRLSSRLEVSLPQWAPYFEQLVGKRRAGIAFHGNAAYWVSAERRAVFCQIFPAAKFESAMPSFLSQLLH